MPRGDRTGPDGKGPKKENKGWPSRDGRGNGQGGRKGQGGGGRQRKRDGSCRNSGDRK